MHNLFGDRFLRLFAGDLQHRPIRTPSNDKGQAPDALAKGADEPISSASDEGLEKKLAEGNDLPNNEEQSGKDDSENTKYSKLRKVKYD